MADEPRDHLARAIRAYYPEYDDRGETEPWPADYNLADHLLARGIRVIAADEPTATAEIARLVHLASAYHGICEDHDTADFLDADVAAFLYARGLRVVERVDAPDPQPYDELLDILRTMDFTPIDGEEPEQLALFDTEAADGDSRPN